MEIDAAPRGAVARSAELQATLFVRIVAGQGSAVRRETMQHQFSVRAGNVEREQLAAQDEGTGIVADADDIHRAECSELDRRDLARQRDIRAPPSLVVVGDQLT